MVVIIYIYGWQYWAVYVAVWVGYSICQGPGIGPEVWSRLAISRFVFMCLVLIISIAFHPVIFNQVYAQIYKSYKTKRRQCHD